MSFDILPECATAPPAARRRYLWRSMILSAVVAASLIAALERSPETVLSQALIAVTLLALVVGAYEFYRLMAALDEMQRRIHTTALAFAGGLTAGIGTAWGLIDLVAGGPSPEPAFALPALGLIYYLCLFFVARRFT